ncbi:MAG: diaminopimelate epimerase [Prevotellaceae bacterium]|jgi:diaminopimelate epimerase|nr:diaminopimelate epimerase [Prevotellaceae bacterium]
MKFTKMHGTGNDYIYVNGFEETIDNPAAWSIRYSDRHKGIGADGLVLILPSKVADFRMRMFNADGSEAEMCGNASRCVGKYVYDNDLTRKTTLTLETLAGIRTLNLHLDQKENKVKTVTVDMGEPVLESAKIPTTFSESPMINRQVKFSDTVEYGITCVSMGNPHAVIFTDKIDELNLPSIGSVIENATQYFPCRINTEFIEKISPNSLKMRVWERGSGETMACGTGASAAVVAGVLNQICNRITTVELKGGNLTIEWREADNHVYLTGEAEVVFEGETDVVSG